MSIILPVKERKKTTINKSKINIQWTLDNSNNHGTEKIVQVEGRVGDTDTFFPETSDQETR